jgi:hypothetical protein
MLKSLWRDNSGWLHSCDFGTTSTCILVTCNPSGYHPRHQVHPWNMGRVSYSCGFGVGMDYFRPADGHIKCKMEEKKKKEYGYKIFCEYLSRSVCILHIIRLCCLIFKSILSGKLPLTMLCLTLSLLPLSIHYSLLLPFYIFTGS